jgi:hypothetical protein
MEDWLDFDYRQMPMVQNPMYGQMPMGPWTTPQMMPYQPMQYAPVQQPVQPMFTIPGQQPIPTAPIQQPLPAPAGFPPFAETGSQPLVGEGTGGPDFEMEPGSPVKQSTDYTQGFLRTQIGQNVRVEFLIGTGMTTDRIGRLLEVGISYILLQPTDTDDLLLCDIYSIKFVTIYR